MRAGDTKVLKFIEGLNKVFIIPPFKRNYSWNSKQCQVLFNDIIKTIQKGKNHYIGNIVYYDGKGSNPTYSENILIDGQQRITTILILICALRDMMDKSDEGSIITLINKQYLKNEDADEEQFRVRLKQTAYDNDVYKSIVEENIMTETDNNLLANYFEFKDLIKNSQYSVKEIFNALFRLEMVWVKLEIDESNLEDIQLIFEKINSIGEPLTSADLLRNYLLISNNSKEQERLYSNYWVRIERILTEEYITDFVEDYLKMKVCNDFNKDEVYDEFKEYVENNKLNREEVLKDMLKYSESYSYLVNREVSSKKVARCISKIINLKPDEIKCLLLYLMDYYDCNGEELYKILNVIMCYLVRFRIVGLSRGSGDLRSMVFGILSRIIFNEIEPSFDAIYYELSNSSNEASHYPTDEEFKKALMTSKKANRTYGKIVLFAIEENETLDTPVALNDTTIEHLMPQKLSPWWIKNFGGEQKSEMIYEKYIDCIGNLALLSGPYNSKNSNKSWSTKIEIMKGGGTFKTTREAFNKDNWDELRIEERNKNISNRACKAIISPLKRERPYNTQVYSIADSGTYYINDEINATNSRIVSLLVESRKIELTTWRELLLRTAELCNEINPDKFNDIVESNYLHKATKNKGLNIYDPIISKNKSDLNSSKKISNTDYFVEANLSANMAIKYAKALLYEYKLDEKTQITIINNEEE